LGVLLLVATAGVARADKARAAEHFALAEKAEARKDWKSAIDEYQPRTTTAWGTGESRCSSSSAI
jgi:hypothetical protein